MLKGVIIGPDIEVAQELEQALLQIGHVGVARKVKGYPSIVELGRVLRAHAPQLIFVDTEVLNLALELISGLEKHFPGVLVVAFNRKCEQHALLEVMRAGVREYLTHPFQGQVIRDSIARLAEMADKRPPAFESTDFLYAFLPSKAGAGASTLALNASIAVSRIPETEALHMDLDLSSGVVRFLLKLNNEYSVTDAAEHAHRMDESLWPQMTAKVDNLDLLHAGTLKPDCRIEPVQVRDLLDFARRHYKVICADLSGNLERYSFEMMNEAKRIFIVCTAELTSLHLAREKYQYLKAKDLQGRVSILLNRWQKRSSFTQKEVEDLLGLPVYASFSNDYSSVQKSVSAAKSIDVSCELGKQIQALASSMLERKTPVAEPKRRFIEYFSIVPGRYSAAESRRPTS